MWMRLVMDIVKPFLHMKTIGAGNIIRDGSPAVFVCNHGAIIGPVAGVIYLPVKFRPWINVSMTNPVTGEQTMTRTFEGRKFLIFSGKAKKRAIRAAARAVSAATMTFDPIQVSRESRAAMLGTLKESVSTLEQGMNLLIFPENPGEGKYRADSFKELHPVFAMLGRLYHGKTGKCLRFYPVFADKDTHRFNIDAPVVYKPGGDEKTEAERIVSEVREALIRMSS